MLLDAQRLDMLLFQISWVLNLVAHSAKQPESRAQRFPRGCMSALARDLTIHPCFSILFQNLIELLLVFHIITPKYFVNQHYNSIHTCKYALGRSAPI
jgi:hypothetical protein